MSERFNQFERVVVLGSRGLLGRQLAIRLRDSMADRINDLHLWSSVDLDIRDAKQVVDRIASTRPTLVLNAAAYTNVDACETNAERAFAVNAEGARHVAAACRSVGALLLHVSTDFVFDGSASRPYRTTDPLGPLSVYGRSKQEGEAAIQQSGCEHVILRTSWLFGFPGRNFVDTILERAERGDPLSVVTDQVGRPTYAVDLADAALRLLSVDARGIVHFANTGECSWYEFAVRILRCARVTCDVQPIVSGTLCRPARRPAYSVLDTSVFEELTGERPRNWEEALRHFVFEREYMLQLGGGARP